MTRKWLAKIPHIPHLTGESARNMKLAFLEFPEKTERVEYRLDSVCIHPDSNYSENIRSSGTSQATFGGKRVRGEFSSLAH